MFSNYCLPVYCQYNYFTPAVARNDVDCRLRGALHKAHGRNRSDRQRKGCSHQSWLHHFGSPGLRCGTAGSACPRTRIWKICSQRARWYGINARRQLLAETPLWVPHHGHGSTQGASGQSRNGTYKKDATGRTWCKDASAKGKVAGCDLGAPARAITRALEPCGPNLGDSATSIYPGGEADQPRTWSSFLKDF